MEYQRNLPDARMVNTPTRLWISKLLRPRADLLHNRRVLRSQLVVRNGFSRLLLGHILTGNNLPRTNGRRLAPENFVIKRLSAELRGCGFNPSTVSLLSDTYSGFTRLRHTLLRACARRKRTEAIATRVYADDF